MLKRIKAGNAVTSMQKRSMEIGSNRLSLNKINAEIAAVRKGRKVTKFSRKEILDLLEDTSLGYLAKERECKSKPSDYLSIEEVEKKIVRK